MHIIDGLNAPYKLEKMVQECLHKAQEHPFETFIIITDSPTIVEQYFFQHTHYLINIEIMSWSKFLNQLIIENHLTRHRILSDIEWTHHLFKILNQEKLYCFHNRQPYPLIEKFIPLLKEYNLNQVNYQIDSFAHLKLKDYAHLYTALQSQCDDYTHLTLESILDDCQFNGPFKHIYIEADHLYQAKRQDIIKRLSQHHDVTVLYTHEPDDRILNLPYHALCQNTVTTTQSNFLTQYLLTQNPIHSDQQYNYYTFTSPTPHQEVKRVVYTIVQRVIDEQLHYQDFMIVYPDATYVDLLIDTFTELNIPHNLPLISDCQYEYSYQKILKLCQEESLGTTLSQIAHRLDQEELDSQYHDYLQQLFAYDDEMDTQAFQEFFIATYQIHQTEINNNQDHIQVCTVDQVRTCQPVHIFFLGMNETIFPRFIKDTALLLDEDIQTLREAHITTPFTTTELLGVHHNDILKAFLQPHLSMTFSYSQQTLSGETLLESSLFKQLKKMFTLQELPLHDYLPTDDYYLTGGLLPEKENVNQLIHDFINSHNQPQPLSNLLTSNLYSPTLSVSQIETYNKCPFQYFIQYGLKIFPTQDQQLQPNELGSLVHYVLSVNIDHDEDIHQLVDDYIHHNDILKKKIESSYVNQYFIDQLKKDLKITLTVLKRNLEISDFQIQDKEKKVLHDIAGLQFKGFVDRIDRYGQYISIIDYKSSAKDIDLNLAMQGFNIQMLLYLKMVTENEQKDPGAVLYFNTKKRILSLDQELSEPIDENEFYKQYRYGGYVVDNESHDVIKAMDPTFDKKSDIINVTYVKSRAEYKGQILTAQQLKLLMDEIEKHIYKLYQQMIAGDISITPKGSHQSATHAQVNPCRYCPYHSICNFDVFYNEYTLVEFLDVKKMLGGEEDAI